MNKTTIKSAWSLLMNIAQELENSDCVVISTSLHHVAEMIDSGIHDEEEVKVCSCDVNQTPDPEPNVVPWEGGKE